ncbi:uncharacterized protein LOC121387575 [Gigantopelta aegis]|uniref:uncharacterized protein LOC121387575 n=1 Tax=Gigantopelta aegis TaxID=1735272 RepID=UPI001B8897E0|nr:uncharacterized protein LOC121387575 [Gigantopelta aegis]
MKFMKQVGAIVDLLWYIDGNVSTIQERSTHVPTEITPVPNRFLKFEGYNDWRKKNSKKPQLHAKDLDIHSQIVFRLTSKPYVQVWNNELKNDLNSLAASLSSYASYVCLVCLVCLPSNIKQQTRQQQLYPVRQVTDNVWIEYKPASATTVAPEYAILETALGELKDFEILFFDPDVHQISSKTGSQKYQEKYRFFDNLHLSQDVALLSYDPGGSQTSSKVIWKIPAGVGSSELMTTASHVVKDLGSRLSEFHTRQMKRDFTRKFCNVAGSKIPSHVLRAIYAELTLDASSDQNPVIDARVQQAVLAGDPDLVVDMRHLNKGRPDDAFDAFFQELEKQIESITAADERRHNVEHISRFISVRDLIEQVKSRLPPNTAVPSESTVLFAFVPKNSHTKVAKLYKSRVPLRFTVQTRQLRASHQDDHYCAAQFKYMREFAVKHRDRFTFVCLDDKSKLDFGEPGAALSSGVRGKKSVIPTTSTLSCLDHDVGQKGSITPSVCLNVEIPETPDGSFYRGQVTVIFKDSIFEPSSPFRHAVELQNILAQEGTFKPVLMLFTDGCPDHRVTYHAVKLSLIILFRRLGLDMIVAGRTAPGTVGQILQKES